MEGTDISGTPGDNMFNLDLGLNTFQGFVNPTIGEPIDCELSATTFCTVDVVPDVDAFQAKAGPGQVIKSVAYSLGTAVTPNASNPAPGGSSYSSTLDFIFKYTGQMVESDAGGYSHHMVTTFESEITGSLDFDISLYWDRITHPVKDDQGVQPEEDDYRLAIGVTLSY